MPPKDCVIKAQSCCLLDAMPFGPHPAAEVFNCALELFGKSKGQPPAKCAGGLNLIKFLF
jgi:hypothetical protein